MLKLKDIRVNSIVKGLVGNQQMVTIKHVQPYGDEVVEVTFVDAEGKTQTELVYKDQESSLELVEQTRPLSFSATAEDFKLASEAQRIRLGYLFDPWIAISTSSIDPLPHQISAVYEAMLNRQPLRFLLADDPGAGKTIMTGLLLKELIIRGDVAKCLIVAPGGLVEQWQDELDQKFNLSFDIMTNDAIQASRTGNWFQEHDLCLCRLDKLSRNDELQEQIKTVDWDLVIVDEAHKMSARYFNSEVRYTKRYHLGKLLSAHTRQMLLLTATPHNGYDADFQLFLALLDGDRFEGRYRDGVHLQDTSDLMRRLVKEKLVTMEGKRLFPPRFAYTIECTLSDSETALYKKVTDYVREGFNRADQLEQGRKGTIGFALTILQRRLASSPEAIYQSLRRRRERLEKRLRSERLMKRGSEVLLSDQSAFPINQYEEEDFIDFEEAPDSESEEIEQQIVDLATAAQTISELEFEIQELADLEQMARKLCQSGTDTKWQRLRETLEDDEHMFDGNGNRHKIVIFTEQRDTLNYLQKQLITFFGREEGVVSISGQTPREKRKQIQEAFQYDPDVRILIATDAAGEGINLQRAHLMVNYDLPWNPNRLEQRFGRIHRIGQKQNCHLWNLVAANTREGEVFHKLLHKLEQERAALGDAVFDVLGNVFTDVPLREMMIKAIREGETASAKAWLNQVIDENLNTEKLKEIIRNRALTDDTLPSDKVQEIRDQMAKAEARKLQPHYIGSFFAKAFEVLGGKLSPREDNRYEIRHVPATIRQRDRTIGRRAPILKNYERVTFHKESVRTEGKPPAALIAPGHPLLDSTIDLVLEKYRNSMRQGCILLDPNDFSEQPRILFIVDHSIRDARSNAHGNPLTISRRLLFIELHADGYASMAGYAPYLDYLPFPVEHNGLVDDVLRQEWISGDLEKDAITYAITNIVPDHLKEVRARREHLITKTKKEVHDRLTREIGYWDQRGTELQAAESAGKSRSKLNSSNAFARAETLTERLKRRMEELNKELQIKALPPHIIGGALIIPQGYVDNRSEKAVQESPPDFGHTSRQRIEQLAMDAVMKKEQSMGFIPRDVSRDNCGYDIESRDPESGELRFLEVKGRAEGAKTITVTKNEILTGLNRPEGYYLVLVEISPTGSTDPQYIRSPFKVEPEFGTASVVFHIRDLFAASQTNA